MILVLLSKSYHLDTRPGPRIRKYKYEPIKSDSYYKRYWNNLDGLLASSTSSVSFLRN